MVNGMIVSGTIVSGERQRTALQRAENAALAASAFKALGIEADSCVAICLRNDFEFFEASAACALLGAYATPVNWHYTAKEAAYILNDCDARILVIHSDLLPAIATSIPESVAIVVVPTPVEIANAYRLQVVDDVRTQLPDDIAQRITIWSELLDAQVPWSEPPPGARGSMIYTSGTTGNPKGVRRMPMDLEAQARLADLSRDGFGLPSDPDEAVRVRTVMTGPMYHSAPNHYGLTAAKNGAMVVLQARFDAEELLKLIDQYKITHMHIVPTMFVRLLRLAPEVRERYDLSSLVHVIHGAAPCSAAVKQAMIEWWGPVIYEYYGSTENSLVTVANSDIAIKKPGTVGLPICGNIIRILDDDYRQLPAGDIGEIYVGRPDRIEFTYHKRDDARREMDQEGYLTNGDMGWLDEDGCLFLADRKNDMVISGGVNIYPAEIEKVLIACSGVRDCAVFGIPDPEFGESLAAHIVASDDTLNEESVKLYLLEYLAKFKIPRTIVFEQTLPREDSGKIFKRKLRDPYWANEQRQI